MTTRTERNTGYKFDLVDQDALDDGKLLGQMGNYDSRHEAVGMKALLENAFEDYDYDYEVRAFESMWREAEEPTVCDWCGHEEHYKPLVAWTFASGYGPDDDPYSGSDSGGAFCCEECFYRWEWQNHPDAFREKAEAGDREWTRTRPPADSEKTETERREEENHDVTEWCT